jgi:hypothetical protein
VARLANIFVSAGNPDRSAVDLNVAIGIDPHPCPMGDHLVSIFGEMSIPIGLQKKRT